MNTYIYQHAKLGDMILCNGLIRHLLSKLNKNEKIFLFCRKQNLKSVKFLYRDEKRINLISINENLSLKDQKLLINFEHYKIDHYINKIKKKNKIKYIKIGFEHYHRIKDLNPDKKNPWPCDIVFYKQFNLPFKFRFKKSYWKRDLKKEKNLFNKLVGKEKNYVFIHDDFSRNLIIDDKNINSKYKIIRNNTDELIFNFGLILENAKEIHIMESSFRQIIEVLNIKTKKLFLYKGRRSSEYSIDLYNKKKKRWVGTSKKWTIVKKDIDSNHKKNLIYNLILNKINKLKQKQIYYFSIIKYLF